jgi:hypothetical protein
MREIAPGIALIPTLIANAYLLGDCASRVVDACIPGRHQGRPATNGIRSSEGLPFRRYRSGF